MGTFVAKWPHFNIIYNFIFFAIYYLKLSQIVFEFQICLFISMLTMTAYSHCKYLMKDIERKYYALFYPLFPYFCLYHMLYTYFLCQFSIKRPGKMLQDIGRYLPIAINSSNLKTWSRFHRGRLHMPWSPHQTQIILDIICFENCPIILPNRISNLYFI